MQTIKIARHIIEKDPYSPEAKVLTALVAALESDSAFSIKDLYTLDEHHFAIALKILRDWRIDRYYLGKAKMFDVALQAIELQENAAKN
jgi:hypothetical protein